MLYEVITEMAGFQSRYQHVSASQMVIVPADTALALGGALKSLATAPLSGEAKPLAQAMNERFGLPLFVGGP